MAADAQGRRTPFSLERLSARVAATFERLWPFTGLVIGFVGAFLLFATKIAPIERDYLDLLMRRRPVRVLDGPTSPVVIVAYDNQDAQLYGKDVDRAKLNELVRKILAADPSGVVLDLQFAENDRPAIAVQAALDELRRKEPQVRENLLGELKEKYNPTAALLQTLSDERVVGAFFSRGFTKAPKVFPAEELPPESAILVDAKDCERFYAPAEEVIADHPEFRSTVPNYGNVRLETDSDGVVRRYVLFTRIDRLDPAEEPDAPGTVSPVIYPSLALMGAALRQENRLISMECDPDGRVKDMSIGTSGVRPAELSRSLDSSVLVDYGGVFEESFPNHLNFRTVLAGVPPERFRNKVVFIGLKNPYQDKYPTIHDPIFPGVAIHATVAHDLITGHQLRRSDWFHERTLEPLLCLAVGLFVTLIFFFAERWWVLTLAPLFAVGGHIGTAQLLSHGYLINLLAPGIAGAMGILACGAFRAVIDQRIAAREKLRAEREKERREASERELGAFLPPAVAQLVLENPALLQPVRQEISILFSDIRSFTTTAEGMSPEVLTDMLHEYLTWMTEIVMNNHGTLDKYIGDAVMALFGAPIAESNHARWACATALEMLEALEGLHEKWASEKKPLLQIGIGINTGQVIVGKMGSKRKPEYTCIGDDVNFASRAEGLTKGYGAPIIVGENTRKQAGDDFVFRDLGPVKVKGKTRGVRIYELLGTRAGMQDTPWIDTFHQGLNAFLLRDWDKAEQLFGRVHEMRGTTDGPAKAFAVWTKSFRAHPPDEAWDGTLERAEK